MVAATSPYMVRYATETRMYSLVMLLVLGRAFRDLQQYSAQAAVRSVAERRLVTCPPRRSASASR